MLEAAINEFAEKGYSAASTNVIAKEAGVAKGLVFHYFGSKKGLYLAALDHCLKTQMDYFMARVKPPYPPDIIDRVVEWGAVKLEMVYRFPLIHRLLITAFLDVPAEVKPEVDRRIHAITERSWKLFWDGIDLSRLREDIDRRKAVELLMVAMDGLQRKYVEQYRQNPGDLIARAHEVYREVREYMEILRYGLYKRPDQGI